METEHQQIELRVFNDRDGRWLEVNSLMLAMLDLLPQSFSDKSYITLNFMYLNLDIDGDLFFERFRRRYGEEPMLSNIDQPEDTPLGMLMERNAAGKPLTLH